MAGQFSISGIAREHLARIADESVPVDARLKSAGVYIKRVRAEIKRDQAALEKAKRREEKIAAQAPVDGTKAELKAEAAVARLEHELKTDRFVLDQLKKARDSFLARKKDAPPARDRETLSSRKLLWKEDGVPNGMIRSYMRNGRPFPLAEE